MPFSYEINPDESSRAKRRSSRDDQRIEFKALGANIGSLARGAATFDPNAEDGDGDGIVQDGTPFERPAIMSNAATLLREGLASAGDPTGIFTNGKSDLVGLTNREVAERVVPDSPTAFLEQRLLHSRGRPLESSDLYDMVSFDPEDVERAREVVENTLSKNPALRAAWDRFGAPPIALVRGEGATSFAGMFDTDAIVLNADAVNRSLLAKFVLSAGGSKFSNAFVALRIKGLKGFVTGTSPENTLTHEWGHYLHRLVADYHPDRETRKVANLLYANSWHSASAGWTSDEDRRAGGLGDYWKYFVKAYDSVNDKVDPPSDDIPFVNTGYGTTSPVEMVAESIAAYFSPDKKVRALLNPAGVDMVERMFLGTRSSGLASTSGRPTSTGGSMRGMSASEMARIIVPSNRAEALALLNDHQQLLAIGDDDRVRLDAIDGIVEGGFDSIDFSPEVVEELRQAITGAIANNRLFRDAVERHGMPPVLATKRGTEWDDGDMTFAISAMDGFPAILVNQDVRQRFLQGEFGNGTFGDIGKLEGTEQFLISNREDSMFVHEWAHYINRLAATSHPDPEIRRLASFWFSETWDHDAGLTGIYKVLDKLGVPVGKDKFTNRVIQSKKFGKKVADGKSEKWNGFPHVMSQYGQMMPAEAFAEGVTAIFVDDYNLRGKVSPALREDIFDIIGKPYSYERDIAGGIDESRAGLASLSIPRDSAGDRLVPALLTPEAERTPLIGRDYLKDATNEEIADIIVPRSAEDAFNLCLMNLVYGQDPSIISDIPRLILKQVFMKQILGIGDPVVLDSNGNVKSGGDHFVDFSPTGLERARDIVKRALDASPVFAWQVRTFGSPPIFCTDPVAIENQRKLEANGGARVISYYANSRTIAGWSSGPFGIILNSASNAMQQNNPIGWSSRLTQYETPAKRISPILLPGAEPFLLNIDDSPEGILYHEWAHGFWARVTGWTTIANQIGATGAGDRSDRISYMFPGNPDAQAISRFIKDTFDKDGFIPYSSADNIGNSIRDAYRQILRTLGQEQADDFMKLMQSYNTTLRDRKTGISRWRPSISQDLLDEINSLYPFLTTDMAPLIRDEYGTTNRQEQFAELNVLFATPDTLQRSTFLTPELENAMAHAFGLKPSPDVSPYVKPWQTRQGLASSSQTRQRAIDTMPSRVSTHKEPFAKAQQVHSRKDVVSFRDGLVTANIGGYEFSMREKFPSMDKVFESWNDPVENWRMRYISAEIMGIDNVERYERNGSYGSDANQYLLAGVANRADAATKEEIQQSTLKTISAMKDIVEGGYASDAPLYRAIRNVDTDSEFFEPQVGSVISMPLTSFSPDEKSVFGYTNLDDALPFDEALGNATSLDKKKVVLKLREGVAVSNSPITRPTTGRDGRVVDMPIESLTAGEFVVKGVKTENGVDVVELEHARVVHPTLGSDYDGSDSLVRKNKRNGELTGKMTESLSSIKEARQRLNEAATYSDKNRALDDIAFEKNRYSSITRQLRSEGDAVDKFDIPSQIGGLASMSPIEDRAKRHGVSLDAFNDESLDADDIEWSTNEWSLGKTNRVMAGDVVVVRTRNDGKQEILTIERKSGPFRGALSLPGGLQDEGEDLYDTAEREMFEEVNISPTDATGRRILGQVDVKDWDPRFVEGGRIAGIRFDITDEQSSVVKAGDDANKFKWVDVEEMSRGEYPIAFGHASWLAESFADDPVLGPRFAVLAEASRVRNQRLIKKIDAKRREAGVKEFGEMPDPTQPYKTTTEGIRTGLASSSSFDRNIDPTRELTVDFWKAFQEGKDYFVTNPVRDDVYNQTIDVPWIENLFDKAKSQKLTHAELVGAYKAFTELVENRLNNDVDPGTAFERRTALKKLRNMVVGDDEHFVKRYIVGNRYTYAAYRGRDYLGDYRTEEEANQAIRNSMSERTRVGLASASVPTSRSGSGFPEQARTKLKAKIDAKQEEIDALEDLNNRLRAAKQELEETGNWEGQKYNIRLSEDGGAPVTYTKEELEADLEEGKSFDDLVKELVAKIDRVGIDRKAKIDEAKNQKQLLQEKIDLIDSKEQNDNSFFIDELLADEELADELRRRNAEILAIPQSERRARYRDDDGYTYVLHWGASNLVGGTLDPKRSRGTDTGSMAGGNTRAINVYTAKNFIDETRQLRTKQEETKKLLEEISFGSDINVGPVGRNSSWNTTARNTLQSYGFDGLITDDGQIMWDKLEKLFDGDRDRAEEWYNGNIARIQSQVDKNEERISSRERISTQLEADGFQYSSSYPASALVNNFGGYGGRYADEGAELGQAQIGDTAKKSPFTGIHVFRVKWGEDAWDFGAGDEVHLVGEHTPVASLIADNNPSNTNPASNTWAGWVDMVIEQDKKNRSAGLASTTKAEDLSEADVARLRKRQSELVKMSDEELSEIFSDGEYTYVVHAGSEEIEGGVFDPSRSVGNENTSQEGNTRKINRTMSDRYIQKYENDRSTARSLEYIIDRLKKGQMIENPNTLRDPEDGEKGAVQSLSGVLFDIGTKDGPYLGGFSRSIKDNKPFPSQEDLDKAGITREELIEYLENVGLPLINQRVKSRKQVAEQLRKDDGQLISAYEISDVVQGVRLHGYGGRYGANYDPSTPKARGESFEIGNRYDRQGIHIARVRIGVDADRMSVNPGAATAKRGDPQDLEVHMVGEHEVVASLSTPTWIKFVGSQDEKWRFGEDFFMAWAEEAVKKDKERRRSAGLASAGLTQQQSRVVNNIQDRVSNIVSRSSGLASRGTPTNPIGKNTEEIAKEIELSPDEMKILEDLIPNADKIADIDINPALKDSADELLNSVRVTVGDDGIPFIYASPHPLLSEEIPDKRNWSGVIRPRKETLEKVKNLIDNLVKKAMGEDTPEEFWARSTGDGDKVQITEAFRQEATKLKESFGQWAKDLLDNVISSKQDTPSSSQFRLFDKQGQPTWLGMWAESLRDLASPNVQTFFGDNELTSHDVWGHLGTGRGFDRHGEWANMLAMFSLMDRWAEEKDVSKEELLKLKALWFQTFEFGRVDGEFKPPAEQIRAEDKWYIKQWAIDSAFDYADTDQLEELINLIDDGNTHAGASKGLASASGSELAEIAKSDIVRQAVRGLASSSQLKPTDDIEEAKRTGRPLSILRPGTMPPRTQAEYDRIVNSRAEKMKEALAFREENKDLLDEADRRARLNIPLTDEIREANRRFYELANEVIGQTERNTYDELRFAMNSELISAGLSPDDVDIVAEGIIQHLKDRRTYDYQILARPEIWNPEARLKHSEEALDKADIAIAFPIELLDKLIEDGRFKTQFETRSSRGSLHPVGRMQTDVAHFGYHPSTAPEMRPVYGYLTKGGTIDGNRFGDIKQYGELQFIMKRDINKRSTYTTHDSLSTGLIPSPMGVPSVDASAEPGATMYAEAQIHGGVNLSDVDYVTVNVGEQNDFDWRNNKISEADFESISERLARVGIRVVPVRDGQIIDVWNGGSVIAEPKVEPVSQPQEPSKVVA